MWQAFLDVLRDSRIRIATITLFCLGFTFASTLPYHSIIGIGQLGLSERQFALLMLAMGLAGTVGNVVIGHFSDQAANRKQAVLIAFAVGAIGFGAFSLFPSVWTFVFCLVVVMPVSSSAFTQLFAVIRTITNARGAVEAASVNSVVRMVYALSWIAVPGLVGAWVALRNNVSDSFGIAALAFVLCFVLYLRFGPSGGRAEPPELGRWAGLRQAVGLIFGAGIFRRIAALAMIGSAHPLNAAILPLFLVGTAGASTRDVGILAGLVAGLEIPFMLLAASLNRRLGTARVIVLGGACHALYLAGLSQADALWHIYALAVMNAAGASVLLSLYISYLQDMMPDRPGLGSSLKGVEGLMARGMAAAIFAGIGALTGLSGAALLGAALVATGCVAIAVLERRAVVRPAAG